MERLDQDELLEYLEIWKDGFKKAVEKSKFLSALNKEIKKAELERIEQAYKQVMELIMCEDMVQQYRDEMEAEQAETELTYIEIILDLHERISDLCKQLEASNRVA